MTKFINQLCFFLAHPISFETRKHCTESYIQKAYNGQLVKTRKERFETHFEHHLKLVSPQEQRAFLVTMHVFVRTTFLKLDAFRSSEHTKILFRNVPNNFVGKFFLKSRASWFKKYPTRPINVIKRDGFSIFKITSRRLLWHIQYSLKLARTV